MHWPANSPMFMAAGLPMVDQWPGTRLLVVASPSAPAAVRRRGFDHMAVLCPARAQTVGLFYQIPQGRRGPIKLAGLPSAGRTCDMPCG